MKKFTYLSILLLISPANFVAWGTSLVPITTEQHLQISDGVFRGWVVSSESYRDPADGFIYTRTVIRVEEVFKGKLPPLLKLIHRGGTIGDAGEADGFAPQFKVGEERLLFVSRRADGTLSATRGSASAITLTPVGGLQTASLAAAGQSLLEELRLRTATGQIAGSDLTDQAASSQSLQPVPSDPTPLVVTNLLVGGDGIPARFVMPDRGESIPYLIDADYLPAGMTQTQAVNAVKSALAAWTNVTSVRYVFAGVQSFGQAAANVAASDGVLRIQLHDHYNYIGGGGDTLGRGGHAWTILNIPPGWTTGGNVNGSDFHRVTRGYVVLQHTNVFMQNVTNFSEVLCHEIGHTLGLDHSSENQFESNPLLNGAIMYYMAHGNGRGATLNTWDINVSRQVHPPDNTPPYCYDRVIDVVTTPSPISILGVNTAQVRGYDLQTANLTFATASATAVNGLFSIIDSNIIYVPSGFFGDSARQDPASNFAYDRIYARYSDGINASPYVSIKVISFNADNYLEGIPNAWRTAYFGSANPTAGPNRHAADDFDGDGYSNLQEWLLGSNPTNKTSNLRITSFVTTNMQWQAKGFEVYELYSSTNLTAWTRLINIVPTNSIPGTNLFNITNAVGSITALTNGGPKQFFRVLKVP